jgi:hypothetical protein
MHLRQLIVLLLLPVFCPAQQTVQQPLFPDVPGYLTLKGDFHLHTVYSDGHVWPSFRVYEAVRDGLDIVSITDHIDYEGHPDELENDKNKPYQEALQAARNSRLVVIQGAEISPRMPPHHCNALFLSDANALPAPYMKVTQRQFLMKDSVQHSELLAPFIAAQKQGAFIFYNHPEFNWWDEKRFGHERFTAIHKELLQKGMLQGIEVVNSGKYLPQAHLMALQYNLTMLANSDEHYDISNSYRNSHRPMTLVFATERTPAAIREALNNRRTLVYFRDYLAGRQPELEALLRASLDISTAAGKDKDAPALELVMHNKSGFPLELRCAAPYLFVDLPLGRIKVPAYDSLKIKLQTAWDYPQRVNMHITVDNMLTAPDKPLETDWELRPVFKIPSTNAAFTQ